MDLGAYAKINELSEIAKKNGIEVPRLRGYRLMSEEKPIDTKKILYGIEGDCCEDLCRSNWKNDGCYTLSSYTDFLIEYYTRKINGGGKEPRWDRIHGFKRKKLKFEIKKRKRNILKQYNTFNKYCGKENILYIHSRIGGYNWKYYNGDKLKKNPWFIEKVDDSFDSTYCDIYARINNE